MLSDTSPAWLRYSFAVLTTALACAFTLAARALHPVPTALFYAAVTLSSFYGGLGPGLLATGLSTLLLDFFFIPPVYTLEKGLEETVRIAAFALSAALINSLHERRRRAEARERAILETTVDCIITIDHEGKVLDFNPAAERLFGYKRATTIGRDVAELIVPAASRERYRRSLGQVISGAPSELSGRRVEVVVMRADGTEFPVELAVARVPLEGPPIIRGFVRDITERRRSEDAERRSEALRSVTRLANAAAHEINNPLAVIMVDLDLLSQQVSSNPVALTRIERAREAVKRVEEIVNRMTRITRLEVMSQPAELPEILDLFKSTPESQAARDKPDAKR
ncbi:MAG TPA: PAS domain S-box protein [Methylomirabilota bacterium]|nr:PAS domain S-box protein [Methylomirabilota bacterium]